MTEPILIVQGSQAGSEAKGAIALFLCEKLGVKWACRSGSINAGHSVVVGKEKIAFQQLPVAAVMPPVNLVVGPGAYVHNATVERELDYGPDVLNRLFIDRNCGVHLDSYFDEAARVGRALKIGATQKGCAEAIIQKIKSRGDGVPLLFREELEVRPELMKRVAYDTAEMLTDAYHSRERILLEGTQGTQLDMHCGPYPYTTSRQTIASAWVTEAGLSPALNYEVVLVARTYPIRVAGNSGPMKDEIDWPTLARRMNKRLKAFGKPPIVEEDAIAAYEKALAVVTQGKPPREAQLYGSTWALEALTEQYRAEVMKLFETTTVTKRVRRIAELDVEQLRLTVKKEHPAFLALTFLNYSFPELAGARELHKEALQYVQDLQEEIRCWIRFVTVGPRSEDVLETPAAFYRPFHSRGWRKG